MNLFNQLCMKKILLVFSLFFAIIGFGQCPEGNVVFTSQAEVDSFVSLYPNCESIDGFLIVLGNDVVDVSGLSEINSVGGLSITDTSLENMQGLDALTITSLNGEDSFIVIDNNPMLQDILFLNNYTVNVPVVFLIRDMSALTSLDGASSISEFVTIYLENNDVLTDLDGLNENLNISGGVQNPYLYLSENAILSDISRLNTAQWNPALTLEITNNTQLTVCENNLVCSILNNNSGIILNNASGCNSISEVIMACENLSLVKVENNLINIYPNPVSDVLFIDGLNNENFECLKIYSSNGQKIIETKTMRYDMSVLKAGIYFLEITTIFGSLTKLVVKE